MKIMDIDSVALTEKCDAVVIIDQTLLPKEIKLLSLTNREAIWQAIYRLQVRGAPAIGIAAAMGMAVLAKLSKEQDKERFLNQFLSDKAYLETARPTAVNLSWALNEMERCLRENLEESIDDIKKALEMRARQMRDEDVKTCFKIGELGLSLLKPKDGILTHCNAGKLATIKYGTATAPIYLGQERGYQFQVFADETRPLLQGARLTAYELWASGVDVTLLCDNMAAYAMQKGWVQAVLVGCDRVAANGDTANKIGTLGVAILAKHYHIPFYVCAPFSTIDTKTKSGKDIVIENRPKEEVTDLWYETCMAPPDICVCNPAFDVTDHTLISAIITERGILRPPYRQAIERISDICQRGQQEDKK